MDLVFIVPLLVGVLAIRVLLHFLDVGKIRQAADRKGWQDVQVSWAPFAPGWLFEKGERHYRVTYGSQQHGRREVFCKASLLTGVYWRDENQVR